MSGNEREGLRHCAELVAARLTLGHKSFGLLRIVSLEADAIYPAPTTTYTPEIFYAFLIAGTGIPAILRFTEPRKFQLVK